MPKLLLKLAPKAPQWFASWLAQRMPTNPTPRQYAAYYAFTGYCVGEWR